ncbi:response regulator transcription factor KdpE [Flaviaesturariibacter terrae]
MNSAYVLVIDDEAQIRKLLQITLEAQGYAVQTAATGKEGLVLAANHPPDLILLDLGLPDQPGLQVLQELRAWYERPVLIVSALDDEANIVAALDGGANDYITKPFRTGELLARVRSSLRLVSGAEASSVISFGEIEMDLAARSVKRNGATIKLTATEYSLLALFVRNEGKVMTHQQMLTKVWGPGFTAESQYLRVYVAQLRKKIEKDPNRPRHLITESGVGYRFLSGD